MADAAVVAARDFGELAQLPGGELAVGDGDAQHRAMALDVEAVLQAQRTQFVVGKRSGEMALDLAAILRDALVYHPLVDAVVAIHVFPLMPKER